MRKDENIFENIDGSWTVQRLIYENDPEFKEWYTLGIFPSRKAALRYLKETRQKL